MYSIDTMTIRDLFEYLDKNTKYYYSLIYNKSFKRLDIIVSYLKYYDTIRICFLKYNRLDEKNGVKYISLLCIYNYPEWSMQCRPIDTLEELLLILDKTINDLPYKVKTKPEGIQLSLFEV